MDQKNPVTQNIIFNYRCEEFMVARRVTLVAAFGFSRWRGPTHSTLSFYECRFSGEDTQILPTIIEFECFGLTGGEDTKIHARPLEPKPPSEIFNTWC